MASKTSVCNMALLHLGVGRLIVDVETEQSEEAKACRVFYDIALRKVLRDKRWGFAKKTAALSLVETNPNDQWAYSYRYPSDCVFLREIPNGLSSGTKHIFGEEFRCNYVRGPRVPYELGADSTGTLIFTSFDGAVAEYTKFVSSVDLWPPDFTVAFSYLLAALVSPKITAGDPFKLGDKAMAQYVRNLEEATVNAYNEGQPDIEAQSEFISARD